MQGTYVMLYNVPQAVVEALNLANVEAYLSTANICQEMRVSFRLRPESKIPIISSAQVGPKIFGNPRRRIFIYIYIYIYPRKYIPAYPLTRPIAPFEGALSPKPQSLNPNS